MEHVTINAGLRICLITKGIASSLTYIFGDTGLRNILNGQVQDVLYAVLPSVCRFLGLDVTVRLSVLVSTPLIGLSRTDGYRDLIANDLTVYIDGDDTVATEGRSVMNRVGARSSNILIAITGREGRECHVL